MDRSRRSRDDLSSRSRTEFSRAPQSSRSFSMANMNLGSVLALAMLAAVCASGSSLPEKYPIEVYHMLQERTQHGIGRDNRVRGTWGAWSEWSECSRTCGTGIQSQSRECLPTRGLLRKRSVLVGNNGTLGHARNVCVGTHRRYHTCNTQECPNYPEDLRAEQCAKYNGRNYKGRTYVWIPFLDAPNPCALNCRAVGERFYATLEPTMIDGTPCDPPNTRGRNGNSHGTAAERNERWLCVAGQCKPVGCDGVIGSGVRMDACGVCGGRGRGCRLYEGIFMEPILPKGHQPITTIPKGAMSLNISELRFSSNFLALRDSNGSYILNGPWSYSPSGTYKAAGTTLTYQRGDKQRSECIVAIGPLNETLHLEILSQEINPGVLYKYMLPLKEVTDDKAIIAPPLRATVSSVFLERGNEIPETGTSVTTTIPVPRIYEIGDADDRAGRKEEMRHPPPTTVMAGDQPKPKKKRRRKFAWKVVGLTDCTKECGGGLQTAIFKCVRENNEMVVNERRCRNVEQPKSPPPLRCNDHPCPARWKAEEWSECSVTCGVGGTRTRRIECVQELNARLTMRVAAGACMQPPDLRTVEACEMPPCPALVLVGPELRHMHAQPRWDVGNWGPCSATCGQGIKNRTVTCITSGEPCPTSSKPDSQKICDNAPCHLRSTEQNSPWLYSEWSTKCSAECGDGFHARKVACADGSELFCNPKHKPRTEKSCVGSGANCDEAKWFTGPWASCSVSCGIGVQYRDVLCIKKLGNEFTERPAFECRDPKPSQEQICRVDACPAEWFTSDWSKCSVTCGDGFQTRLVRCILEGVENASCPESLKPAAEQRCKTSPCKKDTSPTFVKPPKKVHETSECVDKYPNCNLVVKNGLCRIKYYKHSCCQCRE